VGSSSTTPCDHGAQHDRAQQLIETKKEIDAKLKTKKVFKDAVIDVLRKLYKESKAVCFEGNNYSAEWAPRPRSGGFPRHDHADALRAWSIRSRSRCSRT